MGPAQQVKHDLITKKTNMNIVAYKNQYGYSTVKCPFCGREFRISGVDALKGLKRHIMVTARDEALELYLTKEVLSAPMEHLAYYKEHAKHQKIIIKTNKRTFDNDLKLTTISD